MSTTIGTIRDRVKENLGRDDSNIETLVLRWLNETRENILSQTEVQQAKLLEKEGDAITIVEGQQSYDLPSDFGEMINLVIYDSDDNTYIPLTRYTVEEAQAIAEYQDADTEGKPEAYYIFEGKIYLLPPKPDDDTYKLYPKYSKVLSEYTSDDDTDELTNYYSALLEAGATAVGFMYFEDDVNYQRWLGKYYTLRNDMFKKEKMKEFSGAKMAFRPALKDSLGYFDGNDINEDF